MLVSRFNTKAYSDADYVEGVYNRNQKMERALHFYCKRYFDSCYRTVFFVGNDSREEIFQNSFITLWEKIMHRKLYVEDGVLKGKNGQPFPGKLTTYFIGIAKLKYLEWARSNADYIIGKDETFLDIMGNILYEGDDMMLEIIADCISHMPQRCNQILSMYYYQKMDLDSIMDEIPSFKSKDALKTAKYKCLNSLRVSAKAVYGRFLDS